MRLARWFLSLSLLVALFIGVSARAQSVDTAGLEVDVRDPSGAKVEGATLTLTNTATHDVRVGVSGKAGVFRFVALQPGGYELLVEHAGFAQTRQTGITLSVGQASTANIALTVASSDAVVQVNADVSQIDPDRTTIGQTISQEEIDNLPSDGRNFLDFAITVPEVTTTQTTGQNSGFSVNGQRSRSNSIMIDGVENNGQLNGNVRQTLSQDAIAQFQVLTEQFPAEFGGAGGGFINVVTRAGTDKFHGTAYYFTRQQFLNSSNAFSNTNPSIYSRNDLGLSVGGPIKSNRTYFFGALEYVGLNTSKYSYIGSYASAVDGTLAAGKLIGSPVRGVDTDGYIPQSSAQTLASMRIDHRISDRDTLIGRVLYVQYLQANSTNTGGYYDLSAATSTYTHTQNYFAEWTHIFSPTLLNELHAMVAPQRLKQLPHVYGTGAAIGGVVNIGATSDFPVTLDEDHYEIDDALSKTLGRHLFKAGVQVNYIRARSYFPTNFVGYWSFYTTGNFALAAPQPYRYVQSFGNPDIHLPDTLIGGYIEDSWKATSRLTLNLGVRYDLDLQPQGFNQNANDPIQASLSHGMARDYNNFAPRVALSYAIDKKGKTVLRAGYGMFYDKNLLILARNTLQTKQQLVMTLNNSGTTTAAANTALINAFATGPYTNTASFPTTGFGAGFAPSISRSFPGTVLPIIHQMDLGIDRALTSKLVLSITGIHVEGEKLLKAANSNLAPPVILTSANQTYFGYAVSNGTTTCNGVNSSSGKSQPCYQQLNRAFYGDMRDPTTNALIRAGRLDPHYYDISITGPWGHSNYNGLRIGLQQNAWHGLTVRAGYVWARAEDDAPDFLNGALPDNPYNPKAEKSLSNEDVRNRFTGSMVYRIPYHTNRRHFTWTKAILGDWIMSGTYITGSGTPQNITVGSDMNNDGSTSTDRPFINGVIVGRNAFRGARQSSASARGQKEIRFPRGQRLTFSAEAFNLFNHYNITDFDTSWGTGQNPTARTPTSTGKPGSYYGEADAASGSRVMQLGIRYKF
ncbi:TonB-dependent receptor domain-containing protein [Granulicella cerasi]|uniref:TonB-dependent receptor domain-containing protein n=1 Tax=Granulicella cerasi TaxID=741063 RepID=A0ABW1Z8U4_9BACT|nr:TonB-dependent receptor [Granulicella cerasi]